MQDISNKQERLNNIDIYKCVAVLFVIITHYKWLDSERLTFLFPFWIKMAVPIFMLLTGYVFAYSSEKKSLSLSESYNPIEILVKWLRYILPFLPIYIFILLVRIVVKNENFTLPEIIIDFISGGDGRGSYYIPILIQLTLYIPLIRLIVKKSPYLGLSVCFLVNILYEIIKTLLHMNPDLYRIVSLRYIFVVALGCFLFYKKSSNVLEKILLILSGIAGGIFIYIFEYAGFEPHIFNQWTDTSCLAVLLIFPVFAFLLKNKKIHNKVLQKIGSSSYGIFLVQMAFYYGPHNILYRYVKNVFVLIPVILIICCSFGILYQFISNRFFQITILKLKNYYNSQVKNKKNR